jgi:hypothetical protein
MKPLQLLKALFDFVRNNADQIKIFSSLFVLVGVYWEYTMKQDESILNRALSYVEEYQSSKIESKIVSDRYYEEWSNGTKTIWGTDENGNVSYSHEFMLEVENTVKTKGDLFDNVHILQAFYYYASTCTLSKQCDFTTMCDAFFGDMQHFQLLYGDYFKKNVFSNKTGKIKEFVQSCEKSHNAPEPSPFQTVLRETEQWLAERMERENNFTSVN